MAMSKAQSTLPNYGRKAHIENLDPVNKNIVSSGAANGPANEMLRFNTQGLDTRPSDQHLNRNVSKGSLMTDKNAGSEHTDNTVSILDTFSRVMAAKSGEGIDPAKNLRSEFKAAMSKNDLLVE